MNVGCFWSLYIQLESSTLHLDFHFHLCSLCGNEWNVFDPLCQDKSFQLKEVTHTAQRQAPIKPLLGAAVQRALGESFHAHIL